MMMFNIVFLILAVLFVAFGALMICILESAVARLIWVGIILIWMINGASAVNSLLGN